MDMYPHIIFTKKNVSYAEYIIHTTASNLGTLRIPKINSYNIMTREMTMHKIVGDTIYHNYGDDPQNVPEKIFDEIRSIIKELYNYNILYRDITPYNFIEDINGIIWVIDFGDAIISSSVEKEAWFVKKFLDGENSWNPDFN